MNERTYNIATCDSRTDKFLVNQDISWPEYLDKASRPCRTPETLEEYHQMSKERQSDLKDVGGFVGGHLKDGRRKKGFVQCRSMLVLDLDNAKPDTWDRIKEKYKFRCCVYSTRNHTREKPRLRLIIPLADDVDCDEYEAIGRLLADQIGMALFDPTTFQPERLMYWPSVSSDGEFFFDCIDGSELDPDEYLSLYDDWRDRSSWPQHPQQPKTALTGSGSLLQAVSVQSGMSEQADPLKKPGVIGAFCRAYSPIQTAIETFLNGTYAPSDTVGRYDYLPADSTAGVVIYEDKFFYSNHATDPLCGELLNAFDLVRRHKFGDLDADCSSDMPAEQLPSFKAMIDFALQDDRVRAVLDRERREEAVADFDVIDDVDNFEDSNGKGDEIDNGENGSKNNSGNGGDGNNSDGGNAGDGNSCDNGNAGDDWKKKLKRDKNDKILTELINLLLIFKYDPKLQALVYNEQQDNLEVKGELPWKHPTKYWRDADFAQLMSYIHVAYGPFSKSYCDIALTKIADDRSYHPVREFIMNLPDWDGVKRVDTLLVDYLGAEDNEFVRAVTRKTLCAAICRVLWPGCKFDYMLVLTGPQGIGKSTLIAKLAGEWFSDSLSFTDLRDKTGAEKVQGCWIMEIGELTGMNRVDVETIRAFISRQNDIYRAAFGRRVTPHPRQCIFIGTTNPTMGFLRDTTGNRRFWPVQTSENAAKWPGALSEAEIQQIWAEVLVYVNNGEKLYLESDLEQEAQKVQREAMEYDEREGLVEKYLETLLPDDWDKYTIEMRRTYLANPTGKIPRSQVCNLEIWCECFNKRQEDLKPSDSRDLSSILVRLGWSKSDKKKRIPLYGPQHIFTL